jgi:hypothetical protein
MNEFVSGALAISQAFAALFFFRFWKESRDRLFGIFGAAFLLLATQRTLLTAAPAGEAMVVALYLIRLLAFVLIIVAIVDKNRKGR